VVGVNVVGQVGEVSRTTVAPIFPSHLNVSYNLFGFDTIQTSLKIVYTSVFVTLTAFIDNVHSFNLEA
jgi:hypothetical protein